MLLAGQPEVARRSLYSRSTQGKLPMFFAIICEDKPNCLTARQATRSAHLEHLKTFVKA